jgi:acetolactate synthase small subunit
MSKTLLAGKEVSSENMDEMNRRKKEETVKNYYEIQTKRLDIKKINAQVAAKVVDNNQKELKIALLGEEAKIIATSLIDDMDPTHRAWFEKNKIILARDV